MVTATRELNASEQASDLRRAMLRELYDRHTEGKVKLARHVLNFVHETLRPVGLITGRNADKVDQLLTQHGFTVPNDDPADEAFEPDGLDSPPVDDVVQPAPEAVAGERVAGGRKNGRHPKTSPPPDLGQNNGHVKTVPAAGDVVKIPLDKLHQHPKNPDPPENEIVETMGWLQSMRQLEAVLVRPLADPIGHFQVLAGKRRCLAALRLGWTEIECRVREDLADDEKESLKVMGATNAQRRAETPVRQALMIQAMIDAGASHEEAGAVYGLESKSGVTNKLRLLQLPAVWHDRLASAEISERLARMIVPYAASQHLMKAIDTEWRNDQDDSYERGLWLDEDELKYRLQSIVQDNMRPIDKKQKRNYGYQLGEHARYFELTPEVETTLDIVELPNPSGKGKALYATNVEAYDDLQKPFIEAKSKKKKGHADDDKPEKATTKKPTAAQLKAKRKAADEQTAKRVQIWRHRFLRFAASTCVESGDWKVGLLAPWLMQQTGRGGYGSAPIDAFFEDALVMMNAHNGRGREWNPASRNYRDADFASVVQAIDADGDPVREVEETQSLLCKWLLWPAIDSAEMKDKLDAVATEGDAGERLPPLDDEDVEAICTFLDVDMKLAWNSLAVANAFGKHFVEQFFTLHTKDQLAELVQELKIDDVECKTKGDLVAAFCAQHTTKRLLPLPKSIAPIAAGPKAKKGGKRR